MPNGVSSCGLNERYEKGNCPHSIGHSVSSRIKSSHPGEMPNTRRSSAS